MNMISQAKIKTLLQSEIEEPESQFYSPQIHRDSSGHFYILYITGGGGGPYNHWIAKSDTTDPLGDYTHHQVLDAADNEDNLVFVIDSDDNIHTICAGYDSGASTRHYIHRVYDTDFVLLSSDTAFSIVFSDGRFIYSSSISEIYYDNINDMIHFIYRSSTSSTSETEGWKHRSYDFTSWSAAHDMSPGLSASTTYPINIAVYGDHIVSFKGGIGVCNKLESFDTGETWTDTLMFDGEDYYCTNTAVDSEGNIHALFEHEYGAYYMSYSVSEDAWSEIEQVIAPFDSWQEFFITVDVDNIPYVTVYIQSDDDEYLEYRVYKKEDGIWSYRTGTVTNDTGIKWSWIDRPWTSYYTNQYQCLVPVTSYGDDAVGIIYAPAVSYTIHNIEELQLMKDDLSGDYELANDIDASETHEWNGGQGFEPVGFGSSTEFTGTLDGNNYIIRGLYINRPDEYYVGLFWILEGDVSRVVLRDVYIRGEEDCGALAGDAGDCNISECSATGTIIALGGFGGGLLGYVYTSRDSVDSPHISDCYFIGSVYENDEWTAGGLVGHVSGEPLYKVHFDRCFSIVEILSDTEWSNQGGIAADGTNLEMSQCFTIGTTFTSANAVYQAGGIAMVIRDSSLLNCFSRVDCLDSNMEGYFGGLSWTITDSFVTNCYSTGRVAEGRADRIGGLFGYKDIETVIASSFWDIQTSGTLISDGGVGHNTSWMKAQPNFEAAGWDFDTVWVIDPDFNDGYPCFKWFKDRLEAGYYDSDPDIIRSFNTSGLISDDLYIEHVPRDPVDGSGSTAVPLFLSGLQILDILD